MMGLNKLTIYDLTQPTEMHKDYNLWHILRNGDGLANVQNQHECIKIVKELQRQANEVHALRAEVEWLRTQLNDCHNYEKCVRDASFEYARKVLPSHVLDTHFGVEPDVDDVCSMLAAEVERLREERRWRTFPANLPDANGRYVCMWADGDMYIQRWHGSKWLGAFDHDITHWMPLPEPPMEE